jgi:hypothetical protein
MMDADVKVEYVPQEEYPRTFIQDAIQSYIKDLSAEIEKVKTEIERELDD